MRLQGGGLNAAFAAWLSRMSYEYSSIGSIELPSYIHKVWSDTELCERVFPAAEMAQVNGDSDFFASRAILTIRNVDLDQFNQALLNKIPGELHTLYAVDSAQLDDIADNHEEFSREFLQTVDLPGMPPSILQLKVGVPIMLLRNLQPSEGLCNGTRLVVKKVTKHVIHARILTGNHKGKDTLIPRIELHSLEGDLPFILCC
jgi:ATP-dependent DNA helicase PIF1